MAKIICSKLCAAAAGAVAVILSGGAATPNESSVGPSPPAYRQMAREYLRKSLFDPYSVRDAEIAAPQVKYSFYLIDPSPGWIICVRYNAKNRMGAYSGLTENALLVRGDRVKISLNELTPAMPAVPGICGDAKYEPFPELEEQPRQVGPRPR